MAVNQMQFTNYRRESVVNNRVLGMLAFIGAPMLLLQSAAMVFAQGQKLAADRFIAFLGVLYIGGWMAGVVGMRRLRVTGDRQGSKVLFIIQIFVLSLALLFSIQESIGLTNSIFFRITDAAYPLSHLLMLVVGVSVWRAHVWRGLTRLAPLLVGLGLPSAFALAPLIGWNAAGITFAGLTALGFSLVARAVYKSEAAAEPLNK